MNIQTIKMVQSPENSQNTKAQKARAKTGVNRCNRNHIVNKTLNESNTKDEIRLKSGIQNNLSFGSGEQFSELKRFTQF